MCTSLCYGQMQIVWPLSCPVKASEVKNTILSQYTTQADSKIHMARHRTQNSESHLEDEQSWKTHTCWFQNLLQSYCSQDSIGTSLMVQWLRLCFPKQGVWVRSLVRVSTWPRGPPPKKNQNIKQKHYCNNSINTFKTVHIFKKCSTFTRIDI